MWYDHRGYKEENAICVALVLNEFLLTYSYEKFMKLRIDQRQ